MGAGRRVQVLLGVLALVGLANGALLGLGLYAVLRGVMHFLELAPPPLSLGFFCAVVTAATILAMVLSREYSLRRVRHGPWEDRWLDTHPRQEEIEAGLWNLTQCQQAMRVPPSARVLRCTQPNSFAIGLDRDNATVVVTTGLLDLLAAEELRAVLGHEIAHVAHEDIKTVGRADAIASSVERAGQIKGRYLWGPKRIFLALWPIYALSLGAWVAMVAIGAVTEKDSLAHLMLILATGGALFLALRAMARRLVSGGIQAALFAAAVGPLTLIEASLAAPTAFALSRLISRDREYEADRASLDLTGNREALIEALEKLRGAGPPPDGELRGVRFALFTPTKAAAGLRGRLDKLYATHPSISDRIAALRALE